MVGFLSTQHIFLSGLWWLGSKSSLLSMILDFYPKSTSKIDDELDFEKDGEITCLAFHRCGASVPGGLEAVQGILEACKGFSAKQGKVKFNLHLSHCNHPNYCMFEKEFCNHRPHQCLPQHFKTGSEMFGQTHTHKKNQMWCLQPRLCFCVEIFLGFDIKKTFTNHTVQFIICYINRTVQIENHTSEIRIEERCLDRQYTRAHTLTYTLGIRMGAQPTSASRPDLT